MILRKMTPNAWKTLKFLRPEMCSEGNAKVHLKLGITLPKLEYSGLLLTTILRRHF